MKTEIETGRHRRRKTQTDRAGDKDRQTNKADGY